MGTNLTDFGDKDDDSDDESSGTDNIMETANESNVAEQKGKTKEEDDIQIEILPHTKTPQIATLPLAVSALTSTRKTEIYINLDDGSGEEEASSGAEQKKRKIERTQTRISNKKRRL